MAASRAACSLPRTPLQSPGFRLNRINLLPRCQSHFLGKGHVRTHSRTCTRYLQTAQSIVGNGHGGKRRTRRACVSHGERGCFVCGSQREPREEFSPASFPRCAAMRVREKKTRPGMPHRSRIYLFFFSSTQSTLSFIWFRCHLFLSLSFLLFIPSRPLPPLPTPSSPPLLAHKTSQNVDSCLAKSLHSL